MTPACLLLAGLAFASATRAERPVLLAKARPAPAFLEHAVIYQIWMRSFTPEGTLKAAAAKLPYIADLGATIGDTTPNDILSHAAIRWDVGTFPAVAPRRELFKRLFQLRREEPALSATGELRWVNNSRADDVLSFVRKKADQEILVAVNLSNRKCSVLLEDVEDGAGSFLDLIRQQPVALPVSSGKIRLDLGAFEFLVAKRVGRGRGSG